MSGTLDSEDLAFLTGRAQYLADLDFNDLMFASFVRSPISHGRLVGLEGTPTPDTVLYTANDLDLRPILPPANIDPSFGRPPLAESTVRYVGEAVGVVVAHDPIRAAEGAENVSPIFEPLEPIVSPEKALRSATLLFPKTGTNVVSRTSLSMGEQVGEVSVRMKIVNSRVEAMPLETIGIVAAPSNGRLRIWTGTQTPHRLRDQLAATLGLDAGAIRVTAPNTGGAFGIRGFIHPEQAVVAALALDLNRPVIWQCTRREELISLSHGRGQRVSIELRGDADGRLRSLRGSILADLGAYPHRGWFVPSNTKLLLPGPYRFDSVSIETTAVLTNTPPTGPYRGAGRPEATTALEIAMDQFSRKVGLDPLDLRRRNLIRPTEMPYYTATGLVYDEIDLPGVLSRFEQELDSLELGSPGKNSLGKSVGTGAAVYVDRTAGAPPGMPEFSEVQLTEAGAIVATGATSSGQGHATVWREIVGRVLTIDPERVQFLAGDTDLVKEGIGSFGSRSSQLGGSAARIAADAVRAKAAEVAAEMLEASSTDLVLSDGRFRVIGVPHEGVTLRDVVRRAKDSGLALRAAETFTQTAPTYPYGAHAAVVEIDTETGEIAILKYVAVDNCGTVLNEMIVDGQIHGAVVQGLGQALSEAILFDEEGNPLSGSLASYLVPTASMVPSIGTSRIQVPTRVNPLGSKGVAETGCVAAPAAVINAMLDALGATDLTEIELPIRPEWIWRTGREERSDDNPSR